jgi:hypothetical protein
LLLAATVHAELLQQVEVLSKRLDDGFSRLQEDDLTQLIKDCRTTKARPTSIRLWGIHPRVVIQRMTVLRTDLPTPKLGPVGFAPR